ncbi:MAG: hypothetical protein K2Q28_17475 [Hyphomicrobium sp.]|nr:hypothetical protein [Hyphomicrobium sp.]
MKLSAVLALLPVLGCVPLQAALADRVKVTGEVVDTWCSLTGIMFAAGTAHHQCAVWCAVGGIPVSIKTAEGAYYVVLRIAEDSESATSDTFVKIQTHEVTVDGELLERDGVKYLFVSKVLDDKGVVNLTHGDYGIVPFGN